ncbi:HEAT repeat domain-containing protein, partial [Akkermansiaceae bacterium]|nr:HEAT repeat domain-containing protein [Akkermansiaceae bacterium]
YRYEKSGVEMAPGQEHYLKEWRIPEEFYDCDADPENLNNLVATLSAESGDARDEAIIALNRLQRETRDVGFIPEGVMVGLVKSEGKPIADIVTDSSDDVLNLQEVWNAADSVGRGISEPLAYLSSNSPSARFWGVIGLRDKPIPKPVQPLIEGLLDDPSADVRIEAAALLAERENDRTKALKVLVKELDNPTWAVALRACRAIELMGADAKLVLPEMKAVYARTRHTPGDENFFLAFSSGAFLEKLGEKIAPWDFTPGAGSFMPPKKK